MMRLLLFLLGSSAALAAPPLRDMLPSPPVLSAPARDALDRPQPAAVAYTGGPVVPYLVLPVQIFGLQYAVDLVLVSQHPDWDMHEYARIDLPTGPRWVAKDADRQRRQTVVADLPDLAGWVPEAPVPRVAQALQVDDRSQGDHIDVALAYTNTHGDPVAVHIRTRAARTPPSRRNGATMGHSRDLGAIVLDIGAMRHGGRVDLRIDGQRIRLDRLLGFYAQKYALQQTQGGLVIARYRQEARDGGFRLIRPGDAEPWPTRADEAWTVTDGPDGTQVATWDNGVTRLTYTFLDGGLLRAESRQAGVAEPVLHLALSPALPDLRRPWEGAVQSTFALDVNGQRGHGTGTVTARWQDGRAVLDIAPTAPRDLATRPLRATLTWPGDGATTVEIVRVDPQ